MEEEATPWAELRRLAAAVEADAGKSGVRGGPEVDKEYVALARSREYVPDGESIYEIIESMGGKMVPHGSQGHPVYSGGNAMDRGSFYDHLTGNEDCVRQWQAKDGEELFPEGACLAALCHSLYGTQGFQAFQFPIERRAEIVAMIGERAEKSVYYTCAMERSTWREMLLQNDGLQRGEAPVGSFSGRRNHPGVWPQSGPHRLSGDENWTLSADEFTDFCTVQLSHVMSEANAGRISGGLRDDAIRIMAEHLGVSATACFSTTLMRRLQCR